MKLPDHCQVTVDYQMADSFCDRSAVLDILVNAMLYPSARPSPRLIGNLLLRMAVEVVAPVRL